MAAFWASFFRQSFNGTKYREKGKIIGGTKGNKILDYVSGAPTKEQVIDEIPNVFDYSELERYGFGVSPRQHCCWKNVVLFSLAFLNPFHSLRSILATTMIS
jgi:hypothetical protein